MDWTPAPVITMFHKVAAIPTGSPSLVDWLASNASDTKFIRPGRWIIPWTTLDSRSLFHFFRFKVQITNLGHIHWKTPDVDMFATPCICLWDGFNSLMLHYVQTHNTYRLHSISPWCIPAWPWLHQLSTAENHEHGSQVFISKTFLREAFGKILHLHVACMCPDFDKTLNHLSSQIHHHPGIPMKSLNICGVPR